MPQLSVIQSVERQNDATTSRVTDLMLSTNGMLYSTTRFDGQITAWDISASGLTPVADGAYLSPLVAGNQPWLAEITVAGSQMLLAGGGASGALTLRDIDGIALGAAGTLSDTFSQPLVQPIPVSLASGSTAVFAGLGQDGGLIRIDIDASGAVTGTVVIADMPTTASGDVTAMGSATINGTTFLYAASTADAGITAWEVDAIGALTARSTLTPDDDLRIAAPTAMETFTVDGETYLVLADAGTGSLTVLKASTDGSLDIVDYVLDDLTTRFDGVTSLATAEIHGVTWVFAGGSDDGISAFQVMSGGRLLHRAVIADTNDSTLENISALATRETANGIAIFAASATEPGLTRLNLSVGAEDEIIEDTKASDLLMGGTGADVFVFGEDGVADTVTDFNINEDTLDLSQWIGLRSKSQLTFATLSDGISITYGTETVRLITHDRKSLGQDALLDTMLIPSARIPLEVTAGLPGPVTAPPTLPARYLPPASAPEPPAPIDRVELYGGADRDVMTGAEGNDLLFGQSGNDLLRGWAGDDLLFGGPGQDRLEGGNGNDQLLGGAGRNLAWTNPPNPSRKAEGDRLLGGAGDDLLAGEAGDDILDGGAGDDVLIGGSGRDTFVFQQGHDVINDFTPETDSVLLDPALWVGGKTTERLVADHGAMQQGDFVLVFEDGSSLRFTGLTEDEVATGVFDLLG